MQRHVVVTEIDRAEPDVVDELGRAGTATVHEAMGFPVRSRHVSCRGQRCAAGELGLDVDDLRAELSELGVEYVARLERS